MKKRLRFYTYAIIAILFSCNSNQGKSRLRVATAANLRFAMEEVNAAFEMQAGISVEMVTASSGKLTAQIMSGAPYGVFLSANYKYPDALCKGGFTLGEPILFCKGTLVVWTNREIKLDSTLANLTDPAFKKVVIANPQNAPYGIAAEEVLENLQLYESIKSKLIFAENVSQLNQYILNKAADVGITAKSAVLAPQLKNTGSWKELNPNLYSHVMQYVVVLKSTNMQAENAKKYLDFLMSGKAHDILVRHGYSVD